ncbi:hypothetical protein M513_10988 [Trichuris suis]|uniref:Uncharacterized protein n=1 Tax=Trichuris suis TaxID=68888 RepID=A0A085LT54_9BILA|nr:hypothetical protein M513_10988 [Trichuris suis]
MNLQNATELTKSMAKVGLSRLFSDPKRQKSRNKECAVKDLLKSVQSTVDISGLPVSENICRVYKDGCGSRNWPSVVKKGISANEGSHRAFTDPPLREIIITGLHSFLMTRTALIYGQTHAYALETSLRIRIRFVETGFAKVLRGSFERLSCNSMSHFMKVVSYDYADEQLQEMLRATMS